MVILYRCFWLYSFVHLYMLTFFFELAHSSSLLIYYLVISYSLLITAYFVDIFIQSDIQFR